MSPPASLSFSTIFLPILAHQHTSFPTPSLALFLSHFSLGGRISQGRPETHLFPLGANYPEVQQAEERGGSCNQEEGEEAEAQATSGALGAPCFLGERLLRQLHVPDHAFGAHGLFQKGSSPDGRQESLVAGCVRESELPGCLSGVCGLGGYLQGALQQLVSLLAGPLVSPLWELLLAGCANSCIYTLWGEKRAGKGSHSTSGKLPWWRNP